MKAPLGSPRAMSMSPGTGPQDDPEDWREEDPSPLPESMRSDACEEPDYLDEDMQ